MVEQQRLVADLAHQVVGQQVGPSRGQKAGEEQMAQIDIEILTPFAARFMEGTTLTPAERAEVLRIAQGFACKDSAAAAASRRVRRRSCMTAPRQILPGTTYLVTRRCADRRFMLRPSALVNAVLEYVLAAKAQEYGILLHAYCVLSNHLHLVLTDPHGRLPQFQRDLGSSVARALNAAYGKWEWFWAPGSYSAVALQTPEDVVAKMAYVLTNPVAAGLVRRGADWPGLWSAPARIGAGAREVKRPSHFFREEGTSVENAKLELVPPEGFGSVEALRSRLEDALDARTFFRDADGFNINDGRTRHVGGEALGGVLDQSLFFGQIEIHRRLVSLRDRLLDGEEDLAFLDLVAFFHQKFNQGAG